MLSSSFPRRICNLLYILQAATGCFKTRFIDGPESIRMHWFGHFVEPFESRVPSLSDVNLLCFMKAVDDLLDELVLSAIIHWEIRRDCVLYAYNDRLLVVFNVDPCFLSIEWQGAMDLKYARSMTRWFDNGHWLTPYVCQYVPFIRSYSIWKRNSIDGKGHSVDLVPLKPFKAAEE